MTTDLFVPPAAEGLPLGALDSATEGADRLDAAARTPTGRNFLAHALVQLARDGWLRAQPGAAFEPLRDRPTPEPEDGPAPAVLAECDAIEADYDGQRDDVAVGARAAVMRIRTKAAVPPPVVRPELRDQPAVVAAVDWAVVYREVADRLAADAERGEKEGFTRIYRRSAAKQVREWSEELRQPGAPRCPACDHIICDGDGPCGALLDAWQRCTCTSPGAPAVVAAVAGEEAADETQTLAAMFEGLHTLLATSSRDWGTYRVDAWLWAVLCGWDCEQAVHDETCTHGAMEEMQQQHGWDDEAVAKARRYRAAVRAIENHAAVSQPGKET